MNREVEHDWLPRMERAVLTAARHILAIIDDGSSVTLAKHKADGSLLLSLDLECQERIAAELAHSLPVISEESDESHGLIDRKGSFFVVDPIDGTTVARRFLDSRDGQVGCGPMVGAIVDGQIEAACFYHVQQRTLFTAIRGGGAYATGWTGGDVPALSARERLRIESPTRLRESAILFYLSPHGETRVVEHLRWGNHLETMFRFGGFANDCVRLAVGKEQLLLQLLVNAWDATATLFPVEAGLTAVFDPLGAAIPGSRWKVTRLNPVLIAHPAVLDELQREIQLALSNSELNS